MADRETVNLSERMKVTVCLNPVHSATGFPNEYLGDTNLRLAVDVSQMAGIRFGKTIKAYI